MAGEYRGWPVLEAIWDKSVRQWDAAGLLKVKAGEEDDFGLDQADDAAAGLGLGVGEVGKKGGLVEVGDAAEEGGFIGEADEKGKRLLVSTMPSTNTGIYPAEEPADDKLVSPPSASSSSATVAPLLTSAANRVANQHARTASNAPEPFDLPTRTDVIAAEAVAAAEGKNLRGGWVMSNLLPERSEPGATTPAVAVGAEYRDVDLEAGPSAAFQDEQPAGSGTLSPMGSGPGVLGFFGRRPSAENTNELPHPMSLPPTPPSGGTFSPPLPTSSPVYADGPPPARAKSPLAVASEQVSLGQAVILPAADASPAAAALAAQATDASVRAPSRQPVDGHDSDSERGSDDDGDGGMQDVSLGGTATDGKAA
jgi:hypothetical protein